MMRRDFLSFIPAIFLPDTWKKVVVNQPPAKPTVCGNSLVVHCCASGGDDTTALETAVSQLQANGVLFIEGKLAISSEQPPTLPDNAIVSSHGGEHGIVFGGGGGIAVGAGQRVYLNRLAVQA